MLHGKRILVVEDEPLIALDLEAAILEWQGVVVGPAQSLADAIRLASTEPLHGAILDLRLRNEPATDVIHCLLQRGIPCVVHTGQADASLAKIWPHIPVIDKPALPETVLAALVDQLEKSAQS